jgi:hypothetical protein
MPKAPPNRFRLLKIPAYLLNRRAQRGFKAAGNQRFMDEGSFFTE